MHCVVWFLFLCWGLSSTSFVIRKYEDEDQKMMSTQLLQITAVFFTCNMVPSDFLTGLVHKDTEPVQLFKLAPKHQTH